jgi:Rrf2 family protein
LDVNIHYLNAWNTTMFSQTVEYALRAVVFMAGKPDEPATNVEIARVTKVPKAYLSKVMQGLCRAGLVQSHRGVGGGFTLSRAPDRLSILEVVNAVEPIRRIKTCPLGLKAHGVRLCPLHKRMDDALAQVEAAFGSTTLAEVLAEPSKSVPLCEFPPRRKDAKRHARATKQA